MTDKLIDSSFASTDSLITAFWKKCDRVKELEAQVATAEQVIMIADAYATVTVQAAICAYRKKYARKESP